MTNYQEHKDKVLSQLKYFKELDSDEIICPDSEDPFLSEDICLKCDKKDRCEARR